MNSNLTRPIRILLILFLANMVLFVLNLFSGSVFIPADDILSILFSSNTTLVSGYDLIILQSRLPQTITALLTGAALSVAGLLLQTLFRNPLAGPGILGVSAGASLGVAVMTLIGGLGTSFLISDALQQYGVILAAFLGAFLSLSLVLLFATFVKNNISLLIIGMMVGYAVSSMIGFLQFIGHQQQVHAFVIWGLGSFSHVTADELPLYAVLVFFGVFISFLFVKPLNALLLGENYAANLGVKVKQTRTALILISGLLTAVATAYAGPIAFIGLAVPHLTRMSFRTSDHKVLLPALVLMGMAIALACNLIARLPALEQAIPINIVTSIFGAPLVIWFLVKNNKIKMYS